MFKKSFYIIIAIIAIMFFQNTNSYENELDFYAEGKTIKELKENIDFLDKTNAELDVELKNLNTDYELKTYLREDLSLNDINKIKLLVSNFNRSKSKLEDILYEKAKLNVSVIDEKKALLEEKKNFYSSLIPYIESDSSEKYIEYIKTDAKIFNEQKDISTDIVTKKEILNNKVVIIESKIQEHKDFINKNLKIVIENKLDEKINNLKNNESFKVLNNDSKRKVLDKTILKVKEKLEIIKKNNNQSTESGSLVKKDNDLYDKKIQTYQIAVDKLQNFRDSIK